MGETFPQEKFRLTASIPATVANSKIVLFDNFFKSSPTFGYGRHPHDEISK
jgi:hypothetical protein